MNLYKVSQDINNNYDTYDSMIVCAKDVDDAKNIHPDRWVKEFDDNHWYGKHTDGSLHTSYIGHGCWVNRKDIDKLSVTYLGVADKSIDRGIVLSSYNAG